MSGMRPRAEDCQIVWARTPVKTKAVRSKPPSEPKPAWRAGPSSRIRISGKASSEKSRSRSRRSLMKSRWAITAIAESSPIGELRPAHDLEVGVLKGGRVRPNDRQGRLDRAQHGVRLARADLDPEGAIA